MRFGKKYRVIWIGTTPHVTMGEYHSRKEALAAMIEHWIVRGGTGPDGILELPYFGPKRTITNYTALNTTGQMLYRIEEVKRMRPHQ